MYIVYVYIYKLQYWNFYLKNKIVIANLEETVATSSSLANEEC